MAASSAAVQHKSPAQVINVRLDGPQPVDLRFVHRNGETQLSVRAGNNDVAQRLQTDLPQLQQSLQERGFQFDSGDRERNPHDRPFYDDGQDQPRRQRHRPDQEQANADD
jgi:flagellar hook-length control protein FliK